MRNSKKARIRIAVIAASVLLAASALIGYGLRANINLYLTPSEALAQAPEGRFQLGGMVEDGSLKRGETVTFLVSDGAASIPVRYRGILPDLFTEGQGMVGKGALEQGVFVASEILAKHDESYMPRELENALQATAQ
ncbi:cytochrome c maturation protein CcmE [Paracoccaceae bacterium GXU_MW_L88]